jgi:hypothetical protein
MGRNMELKHYVISKAETLYKNVRSEVLTTVPMKSNVFWSVKTYSITEVYQHFGKLNNQVARR